MTAQRLPRLFALLTALCLLVSACGSTSDVTTETTVDNPDVDSAEVEDPATDEGIHLSSINERDLDNARQVFDAAKARWESYDPFAYVFTAGVDSINLFEVDVDAEGNASPERLVHGEYDESWGTVPFSAKEAFDEVERLLLGFESGEYEVPGAGECGNHFNVTFDNEFGVPDYYDTLGPCDDGVGIRMQVTPAGEDPKPVDFPAAPCNESDYMGLWVQQSDDAPAQSESASGTGDEGGAGTISLNLRDGESTLMRADTIEIIGEWFCTDTSVLSISNAGEEMELAAINPDGTLLVGGHTLIRSDAQETTTATTMAPTTTTSEVTDTTTTTTTIEAPVLPADTTEPVEQAVCVEENYLGSWTNGAPIGLPTEPPADGEVVTVGVRLQLVEGDVSEYVVGDMIILVDDWYCDDMMLVGVESNGNQFQLAGINDDGTLTTADGSPLTRDA